MNNNTNKVVHTTNTALPATTFTIPVTFAIEELPIIVEAKANGSWTATGSEKRVACIIALRRDADGRALVSYQSSENEKDFSSLAIIATPENTLAAIDEVCAHLLENTLGCWGPLVASFREKYTAIPPMKVTTNHLMTIEPDDYPLVIELLRDGVKVRELIWLKRRRRQLQ